MVFGKKDYRVQELISAVVVKKENFIVSLQLDDFFKNDFIIFSLFQVTAEELKDYVNSQVIDYKKIRGDLIFREKIPQSSVGKLLRREMRAWAEKAKRDSISG